MSEAISGASLAFDAHVASLMLATSCTCYRFFFFVSFFPKIAFQFSL